jgi:hypothetical protein
MSATLLCGRRTFRATCRTTYQATRKWRAAHEVRNAVEHERLRSECGEEHSRAVHSIDTSVRSYVPTLVVDTNLRKHIAWQLT